MPDSTLDLIATLAETSAALMIGAYTREDWQDCPACDALRDAAMMLRDHGCEVPHAVVEAIGEAERTR